MYFSAADRGEMMSMIYNWPADQVFLLMILGIKRISLSFFKIFSPLISNWILKTLICRLI